MNPRQGNHCGSSLRATAFRNPEALPDSSSFRRVATYPNHWKGLKKMLKSSCGPGQMLNWEIASSRTSGKPLLRAAFQRPWATATTWKGFAYTIGIGVFAATAIISSA